MAEQLYCVNTQPHEPSDCKVRKAESLVAALRAEGLRDDDWRARFARLAERYPRQVRAFLHAEGERIMRSVGPESTDAVQCLRYDIGVRR